MTPPTHPWLPLRLAVVPFSPVPRQHGVTLLTFTACGQHDASLPAFTLGPAQHAGSSRALVARREGGVP